MKYLAADRLGLKERVIETVLKTFQEIAPAWKEWIGRSFLSAERKEQYQALLASRYARILGAP